jgi:hypothetical protein
MNSFFSGTDLEEIRKNGQLYNYYISLVVSFDEKYKCKIAFPSKSIVTIKNDIRGGDGKIFTLNTKQEEDTLIIADLDVEIQQNNAVNEWFVNRYTAIKNKPKPVITYGGARANFPVAGYGNNFYQKKIWDGYNDFDSSFPDYTPKTVNIDENEEFLIAILMGANDTKKSVEEAFTSFNKLTDAEVPMWEEIIDSNMNILHFNIYGNDAESIIRIHSASVSSLLNKYEHYNINDNFKVLKDLMEIYAEV